MFLHRLRSVFLIPRSTFEYRWESFDIDDSVSGTFFPHGFVKGGYMFFCNTFKNPPLLIFGAIRYYFQTKSKLLQLNSNSYGLKDPPSPDC